MLRQCQGEAEARGPAADHKDVVMKVLAHARIPIGGGLVYRRGDRHNSGLVPAAVFLAQAPAFMRQGRQVELFQSFWF
ncbi:hypothetical protein Pssp01_27890 [Pseudomonas sp. NBRC 100443]|nr:hypothetical protein Pssp01_27890 [Pseudomonas sp. NBRC 100443]